MFAFTTDIDVSALTGILSRIPGALDANREPMRGAMTNAMAEVMRFEQRRFRQASGSPGNPWRDIKPITKQRRAERQLSQATKGKRKSLPSNFWANQFFPVLSDTETLERGLFEKGGSGHFQQLDIDSIREGVAGGSHPVFKGSVGQLAVIHHDGTALIPARPVMGPLDAPTLDAVGAMIGGGVTAVFDALTTGIGGEPGSMKVAA